MAGPGDEFRQGTKELLKQVGGDVEVHRSEDGTVRTLHGATTQEKNGERRRYFFFLEPEDIKEGDLLIKPPGRDRWVVTETEDRVSGDTFVHFKVFVEKEGIKKSEPGGHTTFSGNVYGGVQVGDHNAQDVVVNLGGEIGESLRELQECLSHELDDDDDLADAIYAIARLGTLASEGSPGDKGTMAKAERRITILNNIISSSANLASVASPYLDKIRTFFGV